MTDPLFKMTRAQAGELGRATRTAQAENRYQAYAWLRDRRYTPEQAQRICGISDATRKRRERRYRAEKGSPDG